ncbi:MAG TPA: hypothetical protein VE262_19260 [Blastocatellia bacterium]|nr:hypothetical protein [Blastocatellia bacterium]
MERRERIHTLLAERVRQGYKRAVSDRRGPWIRFIAANLVLVFIISAGASEIAQASKDHKNFAALSVRLSEQAGHFDSDNLISNETSYLHVLGKLREMDVRGGVYIGVGPDQNFSYIAKIRPRMAIIIDIRRDNLLHHLLFKTLFENSRNRIEYLCNFFGKPLPRSKGWEQATAKELVDYIDKTPSDPKLFAKNSSRILKGAQKFGIMLSASDLDTIARIHKAFYTAGLDIRYSSHNRPPRSIYPTYRDLLLERDLSDNMNNYLNSEDDFQFIRKLQQQDLIVPAVGDLAGPLALKAIGRYVAEMKERVSAFYVSNVEFYLHRQGTFERYVENLKSLPIDNRSMIIRSYFNYYAPPHRQAEGNHFSTQLLQRIEDLVRQCQAGECETYDDVVNKNSILLR